jgi:purine catabolism regulator
VDDELELLYAFAPRGRHLSPDESPHWMNHAALDFELTKTPRASTAPPVVRVPGDNGHEYAIAPVVLPSGIVGYVWASDPSGQLSSRVDGAVSHAAAACALEMVRQRAIVEGESRVRNSFLEDLLAGSITSASATRRRARFLGYDLRHEQAVFVLDLDCFSDYIALHEKDEREIQRLKDRFRRSVDACIPAIWERALVWEHSDAMVLLARAREGDEGAFQQRVEALRAAVESRLAGPSISAGIGRPYADLRKLRQSYQEAEHAARISLATRGPSSTMSFEDLGAYRLLFLLRDQPELQAYCEETIGPLLRYDEEHDGHLTETLATFLELQGNLSETARRLHLHRNGLLYRLSRIERILEARLDSPTQRLALQLALLARPLLNGKCGSRPAQSSATAGQRTRVSVPEEEGEIGRGERSLTSPRSTSQGRPGEFGLRPPGK